MFHVIYRWKLHPGKEVQFQKAWAEATRLIRDYRGGLGSRLHHCLDGTFLAYARWPDENSWERSGNIPLPENSAFLLMKEAILSSEPPIKMKMIEDLLSKEPLSRQVHYLKWLF